MNSSTSTPSHDLLLQDGFFATPERFLWHAPTRTAILADLHVGFEAEAGRRGNYLPDFTRGPLRAAWGVLAARKPRRILIAGDLFHAPDPDESTFRAAHELLTAATCPVVVLPGNHDPPAEALVAAFAGTPVTVAEAEHIAGWRICHGHRVSPAPADHGLIVGHQHPAVILSDRIQSAKMICFALIAPAAGGVPAILLPAFSPAALGTNLLGVDRYWIVDSPPPTPDRVRIVGIVNHQVLDFGTLAALQALSG